MISGFVISASPDISVPMDQPRSGFSIIRLELTNDRRSCCALKIPTNTLATFLLNIHSSLTSKQRRGRRPPLHIYFYISVIKRLQNPARRYCRNSHYDVMV